MVLTVILFSFAAGLGATAFFLNRRNKSVYKERMRMLDVWTEAATKEINETRTIGEVVAARKRLDEYEVLFMQVSYTRMVYTFWRSPRSMWPEGLRQLETK